MYYRWRKLLSFLLLFQLKLILKCNFLAFFFTFINFEYFYLLFVLVLFFYLFLKFYYNFPLRTNLFNIYLKTLPFAYVNFHILLLFILHIDSEKSDECKNKKVTSWPEVKRNVVLWSLK
jgi:hypothetical protein